MQLQARLPVYLGEQQANGQRANSPRREHSVQSEVRSEFRSQARSEVRSEDCRSPNSRMSDGSLKERRAGIWSSSLPTRSAQWRPLLERSQEQVHGFG